MSTGSAPISGLAAFALLLRLLAPAAASPSERFLQSAPTVKALPTAEDFIRQLSFAVDDARYCNRTEEYEVGSGVYGLIRGPVSEDNPYLYPSDKAVTWLSDSAALSGWVNAPQLCCNAGQGSGALTDCMCAVAADVQISRINGRYQLVAVDVATAKVTPVSPTWRDAEFHEAFVQTYAWVFHSVSLVIPMQDLQKSCRPSAATWEALQAFNDNAKPGLEAYLAILGSPEYGIVAKRGQMSKLGCSSLDMQTGEGGCACKGSLGDRPYCGTDSDVALFCGGGGTGSCDPRPFLCPEGTSELPVGFVRAYLHKFLDAIPYFHGTGFADEEGKVREFIVPNTLADSDGVSKTDQEDLFDACSSATGAQ